MRSGGLCARGCGRERLSSKTLCGPCRAEQRSEGRTRKGEAAFKADIAKYMAQTRKNNPATPLLIAARKRAKLKGLECSLVKEDVPVPALCPVLGIPLVRGATGGHDNSPSLDRIDNTKGYIKGNVIVVSWRANRIKCDATPEELRKIADFYGRRQS